jgi:hypothetical protein
VDLKGMKWRKMHSEELHKLYSSPIIFTMVKSRRLRWAGTVARIGEECIPAFCGKAKERGSLGRLRHGWEDNIRMDFREMGSGDMDWIDLAQDRDQWRALVDTVMFFVVP